MEQQSLIEQFSLTKRDSEISNPCQTVEADQEEASLSSAMAISTPLLLLLFPILASTLQGDAPDQPGGGALQWVGLRFQTLLSH